MVEVLDVAECCWLRDAVGLEAFCLFLLSVEALLRHLDTVGERDPDFLVAEYACTVFFVALILELARLEAEYLWQHHADQFGQDTHLHVL